MFMKIFFKKISTYLVLVFFILSNFFVPLTQAKNDKQNNSKKGIVLKDKFRWNKLKSIKKAIKWKNNYRLLIKSSENLETIKNYFGQQNKKIKIKEIWKSKYMIKLPFDDSFFVEKLSQIDNGVLPLKIWKFDVI